MRGHSLDAGVREEQSGRVRNESELRVEVSDDDIHLAKADWLSARDGGRPDALVESAFDLYRRLISAQAQQIADDFRRR